MRNLDRRSFGRCDFLHLGTVALTVSLGIGPVGAAPASATARDTASSPKAVCPADATASIAAWLAHGQNQRAVDLARTCLGPGGRLRKGSLDALRLQDLLVEALWRGPDLMDPQTLALARETLDAKERLLSATDPQLIPSLNNVGEILRILTEFEGARDAYERSVVIGETARGKNDACLIRPLRGLANALRDLGEIARSVELAENAVEIASIDDAPPGLEWHRSLVALGMSLSRAGRFEDARARLEQGIDGLQRELGTDHPEAGEALAQLGTVEQFLQHIAAAHALNARALPLLEKGYGPRDFRFWSALNNYSLVYWREGEYVKARDILERSLSLMDQSGISKSPRRVAVLVNLGMVNRGMGDWPRAIAAYESAKNMAAQLQDLTVLGNILNNLGNLYSDMGEISKARESLERALKIWVERLPPGHRDILNAESNLSRQLQMLGDYDRAEALLLHALSSLENEGDLSEAYENLGELYESMHQLPKAHDAFQRALELREKIFGARHRLVAKSLNNLARIEIAAGRLRPALDLALRAEAIARDEFEATSRVLSENEALTYEQIRYSGLDVALSVLACADLGPTRAEITEKVWEELTRSRAQVLDEMAARHRSILAGENPAVHALAERLSEERSRYSRLIISGPDAKKPEPYPAALAAAEQQLQAAEKALAASSAAYRASNVRPLSWMKSLRAALPRDAALLAYVSFRLMQPVDPQSAKPPQTEPVYGVFLVSRSTTPRFFRLASVEEIDRKVLAWRASIDAFRDRSVLARTGSESVIEGRELRRAIWDPLRESLRGARQVFVIPDGSLNLVNFYALPEEDGRFLLETAPSIQYASTERDLASLKKPAPAGREALAFGGIDFDADPVARRASLASELLGGDTPVTAYRGSPPACSDFAKLRFDPLPQSGGEVTEIGRILSEGGRRGARTVRVLTGVNASEENFKRLSSTTPILHVASHGFFLSECQARSRASSGGSAAAAVTRPLLVAGMALSGANRRSEAGPEDEDGILTAEEIASLDLSRVDWAVLSACETGVGKIQAGEGVLGLRRAFQVAGAGTLIMSLWKVEDGETRAWMEHLYRARMDGDSTVEAVRRASMAALEQRRAAGQSTHPFYWGGFVAAGDWR